MSDKVEYPVVTPYEDLEAVHDDESFRSLAGDHLNVPKTVAAFQGARSAWQQLGAHAKHFFQYPEWLQVIATLVEGDVVWGVLDESGVPVAASVLQRSHVGPSALGLMALRNVKVNDVWMYPFTDCLLDLASIRSHHLEINDVLNASGKWDATLITNLRIDSPWLELAVGRAHVREGIGAGVGVLDTRQEVDAWRSTLPKNMRDAIRKARSRVAKSGGAEVTVSAQSELPAAYQQFIAVEASGWKGAMGTSIMQSGAWCDLLGHYLESTNGAQIRSLHIDGQIAASQLCVKVGRTLVLLKVAYDEQLAHHSPGNLLMANLVEYCCEDPSIDRIDCTVWQDWHQR